jgi:glycosyltransferase involved in cell wall biosynthesis
MPSKVLNNLDSSSKKILLLIDNLGSGGAQNQLTLLAVGLKEKGYDVSVFTYFPQDFFLKRLSENKIKHIYCPKKDKVGLGIVRALSKLIEKEQFDTLISFLDTPNFYAALAKKFSKHKPKLIISYRSKTDFSKLSWAALKIKEWTNCRADSIVANSNHERLRWQEKMPALAAKFSTIFNAVEDDFFVREPITTNHKLLVIGSVSADKNGLLVIEALRLLKEKGENIVLTWVGEKVYHIAERHAYLIAMEQKIAAYELTNQWEWKQPTKQVKNEYQTHKALILASKTEGLPNVVCEAQACGLPCIVSDVLDHPLLISEEKNGYLFPPDDANALANAIVKLYQLNSESYAMMCENSKQFALQTFKRATFSEKYETLLF